MSTQHDYVPGMSLADEGTKTGRMTSGPVSMIEVMHPSKPKRPQKVKRPPRNPNHPKALEAIKNAEVKAHVKSELRKTYQDAVGRCEQSGIGFLGTPDITFAYQLISSTRVKVAVALRDPKDPHDKWLARAVAGERFVDGSTVILPCLKGGGVHNTLKMYAGMFSEVSKLNHA